MFTLLNKDNLLDILGENQKTYVMFGTSWCNSCKALKPKFYEKAFLQNEKIPFIYVDVDKFPNSRSLGLIDRIPKLVGYKGYKMVSSKEGSSKETLEEVYNQLINS